MRFIRGGICGLIAFAVLASGAVEPWSQVSLEMGSALLVLLWAVSAVRRGRVEVHWNWLLAPLLCLIAFCIAQGAQGFTVYAYVSTVELLLWAACLLLVFLANESIRTDTQIHSFQWFLLTLGFFVSLFGIVTHLIPNGNLYWLRPLRWGGSPLGPFVNHNHFAGFVVLIVPLGLALILGTATRRDKLPLLYLFPALPIGALFLSGWRVFCLRLFCWDFWLLRIDRVEDVWWKQPDLRFSREHLFCGWGSVRRGGSSLVHLLRRFLTTEESRCSRTPGGF